MKSLNENISEILSGKGGKSAKVNAIIKLGVSRYDANIIYSIYEKENKKGHKLSFTFGVEIECLVPRERVHRTFVDNNVKYHFEGYNHRDNKEYFKFVSDSSIQGENPIECVSPILAGNKSGFAKLEACCKALNDAEAKVNKSTGLHIHIGMNNISDTQYVNVFKNYQTLEETIDSFMAKSRRENNSRWCRTFENHYFDNCHTKEDIQRELSYDRYHKVNPESWSRHHTIEFRQHQGSTDYKKISMWANFCAKLVEWSENNVLEDFSGNINDIPFLNEQEKAFFIGRQAELA